MAANRIGDRTSVARASEEQQRAWIRSWWARRIIASLAGAALAASCQFLPEDARAVCSAVAQAVGAAVREASTVPTPDVDPLEE